MRNATASTTTSTGTTTSTSTSTFTKAGAEAVAGAAAERVSKRGHGWDAIVSRRAALGRIGLVGTGAATLPVLAAGCRQPPWERFQPDPTGLALKKPPVPGAENYGSHEERWVNTSCAQCQAGCGIRVRVVEGRAVRIEGNPKNPLNEGGIGPRGLSALQAVYDADRLKGPLAREGGKLVPISWDAAQKRLAAKLGDLRTKNGAHKLLVMCGRERGFMHDLFERFCQAFGSPNFVDGRPMRSSVLAQAMQSTLGTFEIPAFDWTGADYVISFGAGLLEESCQSVFFARAAAELRRGGKTGHRVKLVHAGPDLSAHNADEWLPIVPATNGTLALGISHVIVRDKLYNHDFIAKSTVGFETPVPGTSGPSYKQFLETFTPERVSQITGVPAATIVRVAREFATDEQPFAFVDERSLSFSSSWETALAVLALNALVGAIERPLGGVRIASAPPYADWPAVEADDIARTGLTRLRLDGAGSEAFPLARAVHETIPERLNSDADNRPEVALLFHANPCFARHQPERWRAALRKIPFIVSFSPYRDETVEALADLVLPDHSFLERWEDAGATPGIARAVAGVRSPVIEPLYDTRQTGDILITVARALGGSVSRAFPWANFREAMSARLIGLHHAKRGTIVATTERAFLKRLFEEGFWAETEDPPARPVRFVFKPEYVAPEWQGNETDFPMKLVAYRPLGYAEGSGANQPWLRFLRSRPHMRYWVVAATINPRSAPAGVRDGDLVVVTSPFGSIKLPARFDTRVEPGVVAIPAGGGHTAYGRWAAGFGANVQHLLNPGPARATGANADSCTRVRVARAPKLGKGKEG
ncbi:MAG: molybdopterin-dependent oxidoreductase [Deltaproteobacteria bacterium]|nr:molybdopterin-dependent oxidoreductase [Deltaproteobacteria bacterium]